MPNQRDIDLLVKAIVARTNTEEDARKIVEMAMQLGREGDDDAEDEELEAGQGGIENEVTRSARRDAGALAGSQTLAAMDSRSRALRVAGRAQAADQRQSLERAHGITLKRARVI